VRLGTRRRLGANVARGAVVAAHREWNFDPDFETEVDVTFTEKEPGRTTVELRHRNLQRYGEHVEQMHAIFDSPNGWTDTLNRCARLADSE
jgi:hypothetical protein